ncbi:hypothetical protein OFC62_33540, partial [Escherichia coli]|nr:hypothetical protein [Escherichia coli]
NQHALIGRRFKQNRNGHVGENKKQNARDYAVVDETTGGRKIMLRSHNTDKQHGWQRDLKNQLRANFNKVIVDETKPFKDNAKHQH